METEDYLDYMSSASSMQGRQVAVVTGKAAGHNPAWMLLTFLVTCTLLSLEWCLLIRWQMFGTCHGTQLIHRLLHLQGHCLIDYYVCALCRVQAL